MKSKLNEPESSFSHPLSGGMGHEGNDQPYFLNTDKDRLETVEFFNSLLSNLTDGIAYFEDGILKFASSAFKKILGYDDLSRFHNLSDLFEYIHPEDADVLRKEIEDSIKQKNTFQKYTYRFKQNNGTYCWIENSVKREFNAAGENHRIFVTSRDINRSKITEAALNQSELRFKALFSNNANGIFTIDPAGRIMEVNKKFCEITGYDADEIVSKPAGVLANPKENIFFKDIIKKQHPEPFLNKTHELTLRKKNGMLIWVEIQCALVTDVDENKNSLIFSIQDISWRKETERALEESRKTLEAIVDNTTAIIYIKDPDGNLTFINKAYEKAFGISLHESIGKREMEVTDENEAENFRANDLAVIQKQQPMVFEETKYLNGELHTAVSVKVPIFDSNNKISGICGISTDITDLKKTEQQLLDIKEKLEMALSASKMGIWEWHVESNQVNWYGSHATLFGITDRDFGGTIDDVQNIVHPDDRNHGIENFNKTVNLGVEFKNTYRVIWPDHSIHWMFSHGNLIYDHDGKPLKIVGITRDITSDKMMQDKMMDQNHELSELNSTKDKLFTIISHDLANPLNSLLGFAQLMDLSYRKNPSEDQGRYIKMILKSAHAMADMLKTLSQWSRSQRGKIRITPKLIVPSVLVDSAFNLAYASAQAKKISLINNIPDDILAFADEEMINTVVRNLVGNAIKFSHEGGAVSASHSRSNSHLILKIHDHGIGIDPERLKTLFSISGSASQPGTAGEKGTGLGLLICKEFTELNHGKIWAESSPDKGTNFYLQIPGEPL